LAGVALTIFVRYVTQDLVLKEELLDLKDTTLTNYFSNNY